MSEDLRHTLEAAGIDTNALGALSVIVEACYVAARAGAEQHQSLLQSHVAFASGVDPWKLFTSEQAADILGLEDRDTVTRIDEAELPKRWVGPSRGALRYLGADLLRYTAGLPPVDVEPMLDQLAERLDRTAPTVQALPSSKGRKRLL